MKTKIIHTVKEKELYFILSDSKICPDEENILALLLMNQVLFANERHGTINLYVVCNDIFGWASVDAEELPIDEIDNLYKMWRKDTIWGAAKWCILQRKLMPQEPVLKAMKESGSWDLDESLDNLK